jgi:enoyl-CoA hydratase/carnithine racemase
MSTDPALLAGNRRPQAGYRPEHFLWSVAGGIGTLTLNRPERKNPLTFDSYAEMRDLFQRLRHADDVKVVLIQLKAPELLMFTRMTGDLVKAMRHCPQPIVTAIDGVCAGAGAIIAMASDLRVGTARSKVAFLFNRVGLAGCDMGACNMLPRIVGQGRASELLYTGRALGGDEALQWGFYNRLCTPEAVLDEARALAQELRAGPTFANGITKSMLHHEWAMDIDQAIEAEAQAQALCMLTEDFGRAYRAFAAKHKPVFEGN